MIWASAIGTSHPPHGPPTPPRYSPNRRPERYAAPAPPTPNCVGVPPLPPLLVTPLCRPQILRISTPSSATDIATRDSFSHSVSTVGNIPSNPIPYTFALPTPSPPPSPVRPPPLSYSPHPPAVPDHLQKRISPPRALTFGARPLPSIHPEMHAP